MPRQCEQVPDVANGKMACVNKQNSKKCTPVCNINYVFYQKFSYKPPTYLCSARRVDWEINRFIPDCSPVQKARNSLCPEGSEFRDNECIGCPPGMYRSSTQQLCQLCPKGSYTDKFSSRECTQCNPGQYTSGLGSRAKSDCKNGRSRQRPRHRKQPTSSAGRSGLHLYNSWIREHTQKSNRYRHRKY